MTHRVAVIGLGYVGLPLARALSASGMSVVGVDSDRRLAQRLNHSERFEVLNDTSFLVGRDIFIVCVPTPARGRDPDWAPLDDVARSIARHITEGSIVAIESTVAIGGTDRFRSVLEAHGAQGFSMAFAPERVSPGDREFGRYTKVIAADPDAVRTVEKIYRRIFERVHVAPSIKVAEAAKLLENAQRDVNIALVNEAAMICAEHGVSIHDVLDAAATKWNFARYESGLVGGHCIAVDPWLLLSSGEHVGRGSVIEAARLRNDAMAGYVAAQILTATAPCTRVLILGAAFKPNTDDTRNSGALAVASLLSESGVEAHVYDPGAGYAVEPTGHYDVVALLVAHDAFDSQAPRFESHLRRGGVFFDPWRRARMVAECEAAE